MTGLVARSPLNPVGLPTDQWIEADERRMAGWSGARCWIECWAARSVAAAVSLEDEMEDGRTRYPSSSWGPSLLVLVLASTHLPVVEAQQGARAEPAWSLNATVIEACSCPMFCPCYFNKSPAVHAGHDGHGTMQRFCRFNRALVVNQGGSGTTRLEGVRFWMAGDLGADFSHEEYDWAVVRFEPSVTRAQRDALTAIFPYLFPGKWNSFSVGPDGVF